ncbi:MAG: hypothetical protein ACI4V7_06705 [Succinivibrionaceae bacterium]
MSNEEFYDEELSVEDADATYESDKDGFELELKHRAPKGDVFLQIFPRTRNWLHNGVHPEEIIREDREENMFSFVKRIKDPNFDVEDGIRYIRFRCNVVLGELEIEMSFTHIEIAYVNANGELEEFIPLEEGASECNDVKNVCQLVINNLAAYLSKS